MFPKNRKHQINSCLNLYSIEDLITKYDYYFSGLCIKNLYTISCAYHLYAGNYVILNESISSDKSRLMIWDCNHRLVYNHMKERISKIFILTNNRILISYIHSSKIMNLITYESTLKINTPVDCFLEYNDQIIIASKHIIKIYNKNTHFELLGHSHQIVSMVMCGNKLVTQSTDRSVRVWDLENQKCERTFYVLMISNNHSMISYSNSKIILQNESIIIIINIDTGVISQLPGWIRKYSNAIVDEDKIIYIADEYLRVYNIKTEKMHFLESKSSIHYLRILPDGNLLTYNNRYNLKVWNLDQMKCILHRWANISQIQILNNGRAVTISGTQIKIWN